MRQSRGLEVVLRSPILNATVFFPHSFLFAAELIPSFVHRMTDLFCWAPKHIYARFLHTGHYHHYPGIPPIKAFCPQAEMQDSILPIWQRKREANWHWRNVLINRINVRSSPSSGGLHQLIVPFAWSALTTDLSKGRDTVQKVWL